MRTAGRRSGRSTMRGRACGRAALAEDLQLLRGDGLFSSQLLHGPSTPPSRCDRLLGDTQGGLAGHQQSRIGRNLPRQRGIDRGLGCAHREDLISPRRCRSRTPYEGLGHRITVQQRPASIDRLPFVGESSIETQSAIGALEPGREHRNGLPPPLLVGAGLESTEHHHLLTPPVPCRWPNGGQRSHGPHRQTSRAAAS